MNELKLLILFTVFLIGGCSSVGDPYLLLPEVHRTPDEGEVCLNRPRQETLRYRRTLIIESDEEEAEEIDDPVEFCRDLIEKLAEGEYDLIEDQAAVVQILCFTASRSPAALVRSDALRTLQLVAGRNLQDFRYYEPEAEEEVWDEQAWTVKRDWWLRILDEHATDGGELSGDLAGQVLSALEAFRDLRCDSAQRAVEALDLLTQPRAPFDRNITAQLALEEAMVSLMDQALYLTAWGALADSSDYVVWEGINLLGRFPPSETMTPLTMLMRRCYKAPLRIHVLKRLKSDALPPAGLGPMLTHVRNSLDFSDPGVVFHAVELFKTLFDSDNSDPGYWRGWWSEYLLQHAEELSHLGDRSGGSCKSLLPSIGPRDHPAQTAPSRLAGNLTEQTDLGCRNRIERT